jgi:hypothetical protein
LIWIVPVICLLLVACGDDDDAGDTDATATQSQSIGPANGAEATDNGDGASGEEDGACLLSEDEVADATGEDVTAAQVSQSEPHDTCEYSFASGTSGMYLHVFTGEDVADAQALLDETDEEEPVEGLGDAAEWGEELTLLKVRVGDTVLSVEFFGLPAEAQGAISRPDAQEIAIGIAETAIPRLP